MYCIFGTRIDFRTDTDVCVIDKLHLNETVLLWGLILLIKNGRHVKSYPPPSDFKRRSNVFKGHAGVIHFGLMWAHVRVWGKVYKHIINNNKLFSLRIE